MKIDITSMFFNSKIEGKTATPAWGTSIGQNKSRNCRIDDYKQDVVDMIIGMTYKGISDWDNLDVSKGSSDRDIIKCAVFDNVYINNSKIDDAQYVLLLVREHSQSHDGRLLISYAPYITYKGVENQNCINLMQSAIGCDTNGCWFVYDISIKNQSELHFSAVVVNATSPMIYNGTSKERSDEWRSMIPSDEDVNISKSPSQTIYYGTPGSGKSHAVKKLVKGVNEDFVFRTTFHPDSDYASFVGCYKPVMKTAKERKVYKSFEDLKEEAKYIVGQPSGNKVEQIVDFVTKYANLFNDIIEENADVKSLQNLLNKHFGFSNETYLACIVEYVLGKQNLNKESKISYEFTPQAFTKAYVKAWQNKEKPVYLIIEEINRGNCAQIFGDIFQLLDRKNGVSEYPIDADNDLKDYLEREDVLGVGHEGIANGKLKLPANLNILATMNTSDQSLFPMDSAFKRRWSWECVPVKYKHSESGKFTITIDNKSYKWHDFLKEVNQRIVKATDSEDKQMGNFFITQSVKEDEFVDKVMFYLWNDVCKEEFRTKNNFFRNYTDDKKTESEEFSFNDLFDDDRRANLLSKFMEYIGIEPIKTDDQTEEVKTEE